MLIELYPQSQSMQSFLNNLKIFSTLKKGFLNFLKVGCGRQCGNLHKYPAMAWTKQLFLWGLQHFLLMPSTFRGAERVERQQKRGFRRI